MNYVLNIKSFLRKKRYILNEWYFQWLLSICKWLKYIPREEAIDLINESVRIGVTPDWRHLHLVTKIHFIRPLFFKIFHNMLNTMFDEKAGFEFKEIEYNNKKYRVDVWSAHMWNIVSF